MGTFGAAMRIETGTSVGLDDPTSRRVMTAWQVPFPEHSRWTCGVARLGGKPCVAHVVFALDGTSSDFSFRWAPAICDFAQHGPRQLFDDAEQGRAAALRSYRGDNRPDIVRK